ncbi:MAG TPA: tyrosine-type recombinase/integrase [Gammaproteobacteria bacterium]|nr:tyrosine-type recombinase/integrase [Gammaproteobacteria bacterium]
MEIITNDKGSYLSVLNGREPQIALEACSKPYSEHCQITAKNDIEAVLCWLLRHKNKNTFNAYYKESRRLLLWCIYERGITIGQMKVQDFESYFEFLKDPPRHWMAISDKSGKSKNWPLLKSGLSEPACRMSIRSINSLVNYLVDADYLRTNALKLLSTTFSKPLDLEMQKYKMWERMLEVDEWEAIQKAIQAMPESTLQEIDNKMRTQFLFALFYLLGLRIHEVALSSWNAFRKREGRWWFFIKGKGGKPGHVPVNDQLLSYVKVYRLHLGLAPLPNLDDHKNLFLSKKTKKPLKVRQLYSLVKAISKAASKSFLDQPHKKEKLEKVSPHWLRHLSASHQDKAGIPASMIQANHRHSSIQTTQIYLHAEDELRSHEIQKLRMQFEPELIVKHATSEKVELKITFKGSPLSNALSFSRLLTSIEDQVLRDISWQREGAVLEGLLKQYEHLKKFGECLTVCYYLNNLQEEAVNSLQKAIKREAEIRLFECRVLLNSRIASI